STNKWPVAPALADIYVTSKDWPALESWVRSTDWGAFNFLRHAYLCRALRGQGTKLGADQEWLAAQTGASASPRSLLALANTAAVWGWETETLDLLWS